MRPIRRLIRVRNTCTGIEGEFDIDASAWEMYDNDAPASNGDIILEMKYVNNNKACLISKWTERRSVLL